MQNIPTLIFALMWEFPHLIWGSNPVKKGRKMVKQIFVISLLDVTKIPDFSEQSNMTRNYKIILLTVVIYRYFECMCLVASPSKNFFVALLDF